MDRGAWRATVHTAWSHKVSDTTYLEMIDNAVIVSAGHKLLLVAQSWLTLGNPMDCSPTRLLCPWDSPSKNTGVGCHTVLQGIFLTQGSNWRLLRWRADSVPLTHWGSQTL